MSDATKAFFKAFKAGDAMAAAAALEEGAELVGATFSNATTGRIDLRGADLSNAEFGDCLLSGMIFAEADLSGAYFHGTTLIECDLRGANLEGASFDGCVFKESDLTGATLTATELTGVEFASCTVTDLTLDEAAWESVTFNGGRVANVSGAAEWSAVVLRDTKIDGFDTSAMTLRGCTTTANPAPAGFSELSGRRKKIG